MMPAATWIYPGLIEASPTGKYYSTKNKSSTISIRQRTTTKLPRKRYYCPSPKYPPPSTLLSPNTSSSALPVSHHHSPLPSLFPSMLQTCRFLLLVVSRVCARSSELSYIQKVLNYWAPTLLYRPCLFPLPHIPAAPLPFTRPSTPAVLFLVTRPYSSFLHLPRPYFSSSPGHTLPF